MPNSTWSRRRFLKSAGAGGMGLLTIPALTAAKAHPRVAPRKVASPLTTPAARLGVFSEPEPPEHGFYNSLVAFENEIGRQVAVYRSYFSWGENVLTPINKRLMKRTTPPRLYISVHSFLDSKGRNPIPWADIASGKKDADIDARAAELTSITAKTHVYVCFHHEMENEEGTPPNGCGTPDEFQAAYWHFRDRIENVNGVPKLTWVVTYMGDTVRGKHGGPERWWPGSPPAGLVADQLMGIDLYNRNMCHSKKWRDFDYLAAPAYQFATSVGRRMFIGECGTVEASDCGGTPDDPPGSMKAKWYSDALVYMRDTAPSLGYSQLEALCYSNVFGFNQGSYRIDTTTRAETAFTALANDAFFSKV